MEIKSITGKIKKVFKHYRYAVIVLVAGLLLMILPNSKSSSQKSETQPSEIGVTTEDVEEQLLELLKEIKGVGKVRLLLTLENSGETIFQTDQELSTNSDSQSSKTETVIITDANRNQTGLVSEYNTPTYRGAVVICSGGDNPSVQLAVTQAVMRSTNLSADQICVLKMK